MESDRTVFYTFKYPPFLVGLFFIAAPLIAHLDPENSTFNGEPGPPDQSQAVINTNVVGHCFWIEWSN
jgi:hypothetical protein